ncbi:MAG: TIGR00730 family Rossman fold protein [Clostridia bacterium]|nr:TIGR00730 family Rossman fold protein [Clostridia bacterium]
MRICVYGAASSLINENFIKAGEELGRKMVERGHSLVFGGGRSGMMGAPARGVYEKGGHILGIAPKFFEENNPEVSFENCTEFIKTETMRERKRLLDESSDAFIVTPGGIGTFDEFFEVLTLKQLGRHNKAIVIFNIDKYYDSLIEMLEMAIKQKFVTKNCLDLYKVAYTVEEVLDYIENYNPSELDLTKVKIR